MSVRCGRGHDHISVADVRACYGVNTASVGSVYIQPTIDLDLKTPEFVAAIQQREADEDERVAAFKAFQFEGSAKGGGSVATMTRNAVERPALDEHAGMYRNPTTGDIFKVQKAVHGSGYLYAKKLHQVSPAGSNDPAAFFEIERGAIYKIELDWRMSVEDCKEFGALYGVCCVCARTLTRESSIEAGIGPVCAGKV